VRPAATPFEADEGVPDRLRHADETRERDAAAHGRIADAAQQLQIAQLARHARRPCAQPARCNAR
jgi:hypothetical protein